VRVRDKLGGMRGRRVGAPRPDGHPVFGDRRCCNLLELEWYLLHPTDDEWQGLDDEVKTAIDMNAALWAEHAPKIHDVVPANDSDPAERVIDFVKAHAKVGNGVALLTSSLVHTVDGADVTDHTIEVRSVVFLSCPIVSGQRMKHLDLRKPGIVLLGYEVRLAGKNEWDDGDWGRGPVPLHTMPNSHMVGDGMLEVRGYPGFVALAVLDAAGEEGLAAACDVAKREGILMDDMLAVVQYEVPTWALTPPVVATVRAGPFLFGLWRGGGGSTPTASCRRTTGSASRRSG